MTLNLSKKSTLIATIPSLILCLAIIFFARSTYKESLLQTKRKEISQLVHVAAEQAQRIYQEDPKNFEKNILSNFKDLKFDKTNYFFVYNFEGTVISHANPKLIGKNLINFKDKAGKALIQDFVKAAKSSSGKGFVDYHWPSMKDANVLVVKYGYGERIGNSTYFVGSGVYVDDIDLLVNNFSTRLFIKVIIGLVFISLITAYFIRKNVIRPIEDVTRGLQNSLSNLNSYTEEMSDTSDQLSGSSTNLSSSLDQTVASMEEISSMIAQNVESSKDSERSSTESGEVVSEGVNIVQKMVEAINSISETNQNVTTKMQDNSKRVEEILNFIQEIDDKTKVINDIVFQTKLLSFNASVEAARAGEQGKGFAVVAEEVGNLATMSGKSADEISELISRSLEHVKKNVEQTQTDIKEIIQMTDEKVQAGITIADDNRKVLSSIQENVHIVKSKVGEIVMASEEQSRGVDEVNNAMRSLDLVSKNNLEISNKVKTVATHLESESQSIERALDSLVFVIDGKKAA